MIKRLKEFKDLVVSNWKMSLCYFFIVLVVHFVCRHYLTQIINPFDAGGFSMLAIWVVAIAFMNYLLRKEWRKDKEKLDEDWKKRKAVIDRKFEKEIKRIREHIVKKTEEKNDNES